MNEMERTSKVIENDNFIYTPIAFLRFLWSIDLRIKSKQIESDSLKTKNRDKIIGLQLNKKTGEWCWMF